MIEPIETTTQSTASLDAIRRLTAAIFETDVAGELYRLMRALHDMYALVTGIRAGSLPAEGIYLPQGKAIGPVAAAHCLLEPRRTEAFLKGIYQAILQLQQTFPGTKINILYAGCGPYASLLTPMTMLFPATAISFTLLDVNPVSLQAAKKLYEELELTEYVNRFELADAITYRVDETDDIHMIVSEAMLNGLRREPQVAIMQNLVPQLQRGGIFIPYEITVSAWLTSWQEEMEAFVTDGRIPSRLLLGNVYTIGCENVEVPCEVRLSIPAETNGLRGLQLLTDITVFGGAQLKAYDSSITLPINLFNVTGHEGKTVHLWYVMGKDPHFVYKIEG